VNARASSSGNSRLDRTGEALHRVKAARQLLFYVQEGVVSPSDVVPAVIRLLENTVGYLVSEGE
jgi:hypothetical protein